MILTDEDIEALRSVDDCGEAAPEFSRIARIAESAVLRKLRERPADAYIQHSKTETELEWQKDEEMEGFYSYTPLHIIPEVNP